MARSSQQPHRISLRLLVTLVVPLFAVFSLPLVIPALAAGVVTDCSNDADFSAKLVGGGMVTFSCGPATIVLASTKTITENTTIEGGGVITLSGADARRLFIVDAGAALTLSNVALVHGNSITGGGAIFNSGALHLAGSRLSNNTATVLGGVLFNIGMATVDGSIFSSNSAPAGGAIGNAGTLSVNFSNFSGNSASQRGGVLFNDPLGTATLNNSTFSDNSALYGGGIYNYGIATLSNSTLNANTAGYGGGIYHNWQSTDLTNVTLSSNTAMTMGGALLTEFAGSVRLSNVTASGNSAPAGGGLHKHVDVQIVLSNTIVAHSAGGNCSGGVTSSRFSISSDGSCALGGTGDQNDVSPALMPLGNYGGPTQTHLPLAGSPAIDAVLDDNAPATDQRGVERPQGAHPDIGSVERQASDAQFRLLFLPLILR